MFFAKGTAPSKWCQRFEERGLGRVVLKEKDDAFAALRVHADTAGDTAPPAAADTGSTAALPEVALVRLPDPRVEAARGAGRVHVVRLYEETPGVVLPKEHELTLLERLHVADLAGEIVHYTPSETGPVDVRAVRDAVLVVAANVGVACAPRPLLRALNNKDTENRDLVDGVSTTIAAVFAVEDDCDLVQDFIGTTRGRKPESSRNAAPGKKTAREKALAKQARAGKSAAGGSSRGGKGAARGGGAGRGGRGGRKPGARRR
ncbi:LysR family transcriptional regulator [Corynebacterium sp. 13CS0277]|nr:LysR family transcriptional regulator [Corynebacterium sp. 13CS0277]